MVTELIGRKIGMTQVFEKEEGNLIPVTVVELGPCRVVQVKTAERDGYNAVQLGFDEETREARLKKPESGHCKKHGTTPFRHLREVRLDDVSGLEPGTEFKADLFEVGDKVHVTGTSKGKGFAGVIKRHGFSGGPASHGSRFHRGPGSIGFCALPNKIFKGRRMPGHLGVDRVTVKNLRVMEVMPDQNIILLRGAVPGAKNGLVRVRKRVDSKKS